MQNHLIESQFQDRILAIKKIVSRERIVPKNSEHLEDMVIASLLVEVEILKYCVEIPVTWE